MHACMHAYIHTCILTYIHTYIHGYILWCYTYICIYIYICICTYIYIYRDVLVLRKLILITRRGRMSWGIRSRRWTTGGMSTSGISPLGFRVQRHTGPSTHTSRVKILLPKPRHHPVARKMTAKPTGQILSCLQGRYRSMFEPPRILPTNC